MENNEEFNYEFDYLKDYVLAYLKKVDPSTTYYCKASGLTFIFIKAQNYILCEKKDFADSIFFAEVEIDWNEAQFFPLVKKDTFKQINVLELREYIGSNLASMSEIKRLLKIKKASEEFDEDDS